MDGSGVSPLMTRILLVTNDFPPRRGGIQSYLEQFVRRLVSAGDELTVYAPRWKGAPDYDRAAPFVVVTERPVGRVENTHVMPPVKASATA